MQQFTRAAAAQEAAGEDTTVASIFDPAWIVQFQRAWIDASTQMMKMPLSGDVTQWIRAWGEAVGQVGLVNVNYSGSRDPQAERRITGRYSYGSQLGRILEVLAPYVKAHQDQFGGAAGAKAVSDFLQMADEVRELKQASVDDLLDKVRQWQSADDFASRLQQLRDGLRVLEEAARRG
jgi:hypothetical protein